jgi:hypothetical protein
MIELSNSELLARLRDGEDNFAERKPFKDKDGWLKTAVAFANAAPIGWPAILFVGVTDKGAFQTNPPNLEHLQKEITAEISRAYPPIYNLPKIVTDENGSRCIAVLIPGSELRPHFSGKSFVRIGPETKEVSEKQFEELIAARTSKAGEILRWKNKLITFEHHYQHLRRGSSISESAVLECNAFFVTLGRPGYGSLEPNAFPLSRIEVSFDHSNARLKLHYQAL